MSNEIKDSEVIAAVTDKLKRMHAEGKDICGGFFTAQNGNVQLSCTSISDTQYSVLYCVGDHGWPFTVDKSKIHSV